MIRKTLLALSFAGLTFAGGQALAGPIDPLLVGGLNVIEDTSGEIVYRCADDASTSLDRCRQLTAQDTIQNAPGSVEAGTFDVVAGILDFGRINGTELGGTNKQFSGLFATKLDGLVFNGFNNIVVQTAVGADLFQAIFGIDLNTVALDQGTPDDVVGLFYQDNGRATIDALTNGTFADAVAATSAGTFAAAVGLVADTDFFQASPQNPNSTIPGGGTAGNQTTLLNIAFALTFQAYELSGTFVPGGTSTANLITFDEVFGDITGTGSVTKPAGQSVNSSNFHFGDDIDAEFVRIPEPTTVGLLGLGLLGFGAMARRRRRTA